MKRLGFFLAVALVLVVGACKKDKVSFKESDMIGCWTCVKTDNSYIDPDNMPPYSFVVEKDKTGVLYYRDRILFKGTWALNGSNLELTGLGECPKTVLHKLDGIRMSWTQTFSDGESYEEEFINLQNIIPGKWSIRWDSELYIGEFDDAGNSYMSKGGVEPATNGYWDLYVPDAPSPAYFVFRIQNKFWFSVRSASEKFIKAIGPSNAEVTLEKL